MRGGRGVPGKTYLANAFSLNMLPLEEDDYDILYVARLDPQEFINYLRTTEFISAIGHKSTAELLTRLAGVKVEANRIPITLEHGDKLLVVQLAFRPEEGKVYSREELERFLEEGKIKFFLVHYCE